MRLNPRKLVIAFGVLSVLLVVYLVYMRFSGGESIDLSTRDRFSSEIPPSMGDLPDDDEPSAGPITPGTVRQTVFRHKNADGIVDREFGFDELLRQEGNQWEITKPYMRLFTPQFRCDITANHGKARCETSLGNQIMAEDAMFSGNVVVHIIPHEPNDPMEMYVYLDDITFLADKSLFTTLGPVKFISRVGQLVGRGMDLIYDGGRNRLELFRITEVGSLRFRSADLKTLFAGRDTDTASDSGPVPVTEPVDTGVSEIAAAPPQNEEPPVDLYECVFWENVQIETPEQIVVALRHLAINNIAWSGDNAAGDEPPTPAVVSQPQPSDANAPDSVPYPGPNALDTSPSTYVALTALPESSFDIVVTCEGGFVIGPKGVAADLVEPNEVTVAADEDLTLPELTPDPNYQTLCARQIDVDAMTSDANLAGPVRITAALDPNLVFGREGEPMPVVVTATDAVRYLAQTDQISFEGDCVATIHETVKTLDAEPEYHDYTLQTPRLLLDLDTSSNQGRVDRAVTSGGMVSVYGERLVGDKQMGFVRLDGTHLSCGFTDQEFVVTGPGRISLYNGQPDESADNAEGTVFSLRQPCYALVSDFSRLTYLGLDQQIVAESDERIQFGYVPLLADGSRGPQTTGDAGHLDIRLTQTADGEIDLATLTASRGVTYGDGTQDFAGSTLVYDHATSLLHVTGDAAQPCLFNGVPVDQIEMDVSTRDAKGRIQDSGAIQVR